MSEDKQKSHQTNNYTDETNETNETNATTQTKTFFFYKQTKHTETKAKKTNQTTRGSALTPELGAALFMFGRRVFPAILELGVARLTFEGCFRACSILELDVALLLFGGHFGPILELGVAIFQVREARFCAYSRARSCVSQRVGGDC